MGRPAPRFRIPYWVAATAGATCSAISALTRSEPAVPMEGVRMARKRMFFDPSKAVRELGLPQTPVEDALSRAVRWFIDHGYVHAERRARLETAWKGG